MFSTIIKKIVDTDRENYPAKELNGVALCLSIVNPLMVSFFVGARSP